MAAKPETEKRKARSLYNNQFGQYWLICFELHSKWTGEVPVPTCASFSHAEISPHRNCWPA